MTGETTSAMDTAVSYYRAWTSGDIDGAMSLVADGVTCHAPPGTLTGMPALQAFMGPFAASLTRSELLAAYGSDDEALIMYDTANPAVASAPGAEFYRLEDGRIVEIRIIFDRLPFALARGDVVQAQQ